MKLALTYDLKADQLALGRSSEEVAELDQVETIDSIQGALEAEGHVVERVGGAVALAARLVAGARWDLVFNIAEGIAGSARESQVPALLDAFGVAYTFGDALTLAVCLDKRLAKHVVRERGVPTPDFAVVADAGDARALSLPFPLFVKPLAEGSSLGIGPRALVQNEAELLAACAAVGEHHHQPALVERYLPGREFSVGILGTGVSAHPVGVLEITLLPGADPGLYSFDNKQHYHDRVQYRVATDPEALRARDVALDAYRALGCRDGGRVDVRSDEHGVPSFIEANPLPGLSADSDLPILAGLVGMSFVDLVRGIVESASARLAREALQKTR